MEDERLKEKRPSGELQEVKVDVHSGDLDIIHSDARPVIHDRDPKRVNTSLKVTNVHQHEPAQRIRSTGHGMGFVLESRREIMTGR